MVKNAALRKGEKERKTDRQKKYINELLVA